MYRQDYLIFIPIILFYTYDTVLQYIYNLQMCTSFKFDLRNIFKPSRVGSLKCLNFCATR